MKKYIVFFGLIGSFLLVTSFIANDKKQIKWLSVAEVSAAYSSSPKPIFIDLYTDWCGWCKHMDKTTFRNAKLVDYVNEKFYPVKFNAESKTPVTFNGKTYKYDADWKVHELAVFLSHKNLEFPQTIFMSNPSAVPTPLIGYMKAKEMEMPVKYFGEQANAKQSFEDFAKGRKKEW